MTSIGSSGVTTPPRPVKYRYPPASIVRSRSVTGTPSSVELGRDRESGLARRVPAGDDGSGEDHRRADHERDHAPDEGAIRRLRVRGLPAGDDACEEQHPLDGQDRGVRREPDGRVDERAARDVERIEERRAREGHERVDEPRLEVARAAAAGDPEEEERQEDDRRDHHREVAERIQEPLQPRGDDRAPALAEEPGRRRVGRDRVPLRDLADPQGRAGRRRRRDGAEDRDLAEPPRPHDQHEQAEGREGREERDRRPVVDPGPRPSAPAISQEPQPVRQPDQGDRAGEEDAVVPRERRQAREETGEGERSTVALEPPRGQPQGRRDERVEDREVLGLGQKDGDGARDGADDARRRADDGPGAGVTRDEPRQGRDQRADEDARQGVRQRRRAEDGDERRLDEAREREPVGVRGDREDRRIREPVADLGEDPDEVDVQPVAGRDRPRDVDVVVEIGVRGIRVQRYEDGANDQRQRVQQQRRAHEAGAYQPARTDLGARKYFQRC